MASLSDFDSNVASLHVALREACSGLDALARLTQMSNQRMDNLSPEQLATRKTILRMCSQLLEQDVIRACDRACSAWGKFATKEVNAYG